MATELMLIAEMVIMASAAWLFVMLAFGYGTIAQAGIITLLGAFMVSIIAGNGPILFASVFAAGGMYVMGMYKRKFVDSVTFVAIFIFIGLALFGFE